MSLFFGRFRGWLTTQSTPPPWIGCIRRETKRSFHLNRTHAVQISHVRVKDMDLENRQTWEKDWKKNTPAWHRKYVSPMLIKHYDDFTSGRKNLRVLVPLCGKSLDMIWLADQGHAVIGVEMIRKAIETFFEENKLEYFMNTAQTSAGGEYSLFKAKQKDITLIECNIFDLSRELYQQKFDCIWDRGSLTMVTMMHEARLKQYVDIMLSSLRSDGRYFLMCFRHESGKNEGEWISHLPEEKLIELCGDRCNVQLVEQDDVNNDPVLLEAYSTASQHSIFYYFVTYK